MVHLSKNILIMVVQILQSTKRKNSFLQILIRHPLTIPMLFWEKWLWTRILFEALSKYRMAHQKLT